MSERVSDQLVRLLECFGVQRVYGIPGDTIDTLMDSLRRSEKVEFVVCRHEENAAFMASGEARITGKLAVVVACQGPGTNNLVNGLADATADRLPVLALTGQVDRDVLGTGMPQESSQLSLLKDITVFNEEARSAKNLLNLFTLAAIKAVSVGGAAHISIPSDVMIQKVKSTPLPNSQALLSPPQIQPSESAINEMLNALSEHKKIAILYGDGARCCPELLVELSERLQAPLIHTTRSKDLVSDQHSNVMGGIGIMGNHCANHALHRADLLVIVGCNYAWSQFYPPCKKIKIDSCSSRLASHIHVDIPVLGSADLVLKKVLADLPPRKEEAFLCASQNSLVKYIDHLNENIQRSESNNKVHPAKVMKALSILLNEDAQIFGDSGSSTIWINNYLPMNGKQRFIWSANLATLGGALPQAIGGAFAYPEKQTVVIAGDGGFQMSVSDLITAAMYELPIKVIILNNSRYWFIENEEASHDGNVPSGTRFVNPDYKLLAESCYFKGFTVQHPSDLAGALRTAMSDSGPALINIHVDPDVFLIPPALTPPMVAHYMKSQIKSWFTPPSDDAERLINFSKKFDLKD
ncbi:MAG: thiamine pyrophosphate-binding protein [Endozoicomonas sp. (ex Botrylloides leachii)]|nr:thiamine pyrophosphate-binding protein [Endozoicomonas sp. (ex Botrylloides leachii)]